MVNDPQPPGKVTYAIAAAHPPESFFNLRKLYFTYNPFPINSQGMTSKASLTSLFLRFNGPQGSVPNPTILHGLIEKAGKLFNNFIINNINNDKNANNTNNNNTFSIFPYFNHRERPALSVFPSQETFPTNFDPETSRLDDNLKAGPMWKYETDATLIKEHEIKMNEACETLADICSKDDELKAFTPTRQRVSKTDSSYVFGSFLPSACRYAPIMRSILDQIEHSIKMVDPSFKLTNSDICFKTIDSNPMGKPHVLFIRARFSPECVKNIPAEIILPDSDFITGTTFALMDGDIFCSYCRSCEHHTGSCRNKQTQDRKDRKNGTGRFSGQGPQPDLTDKEVPSGKEPGPHPKIASQHAKTTTPASSSDKEVVEIDSSNTPEHEAEKLLALVTASGASVLDEGGMDVDETHTEENGEDEDQGMIDVAREIVNSILESRPPPESIVFTENFDDLPTLGITLDEATNPDSSVAELYIAALNTYLFFKRDKDERKVSFRYAGTGEHRVEVNDYIDLLEMDSHNPEAFVVHYENNDK